MQYKASACLIMLNAKQSSHWYHFNVFCCLVYCLAHQVSTGGVPLLQIFGEVVMRPWLSIAGQLIVSASPRFFLNNTIRYHDLFDCH